ncbi:MAG: hypothetical protein GOP50_01675 [Candidatus Heimdallarchaeota archaeon]|nr:hypothetical protein [Candidatus Heimdallarchaeota archaeon]
MSSLLTKNKQSKFIGSNKAIYTIRKGNKVTLYCAFIVKPHKKVTREDKKKKSFSYSEPAKKETPPTILDVLNQVKKLKTSVHRIFLPGNVKRKNLEEQNNKSKQDDPLLDELFENENQIIDVKITFYLLKAWKTFEIGETFFTVDDLMEEFVFLLRNELKQKVENIGKVGRLLGQTLEEFIHFSTLENKNFLSTGKKIFTELTNDYFTIEKEKEFLKNFSLGPAVDQRRKSVFSFPTGIESDSDFIIGQADNEIDVGLPENASFPILLAGDKKTREIITNKILEGKKFIILDPRLNLEFKDRIDAPSENLVLGDSFSFNVLTPVLKDYTPEKLAAQYMSNFIDIIRLVSDVRGEGAVLLRDLYDFYVNEYQDEQEDVLFPRHDLQVSLNDLYTMLTVEPGGLVITDFQLSTIRSLINEIRDPCISETTKIFDNKGLEELFSTSKIIDFSSQGYKIQRLFIYSFLLQLSIYDQISNDKEEIIIYIDDSELFFSWERNNNILVHILKKLENSRFKIILSTPYPSHLSPSIFDMTNNRIVGNLKSAKCTRLLADSHGFYKGQVDFLRRLPKNSFFLIREDLAEKPILLNFFPKDVEKHEMQVIETVRTITKKSTISEEDKKKLAINYEDFVKLHPVMREVLEKLSSKVNRGINTESLPNLFNQWPKNEVKETISALEMFGYIFFESVDKKGKKNEFWTKITPRGKKFLEKIKYSKLLEEQNKEVEYDAIAEENLVEYVKKPNILELKDITEEQPLVTKLQIIRKIIRDTRDSVDTPENQLDILHSFLVQIVPLLEEDYTEESLKLDNFLVSLQNLLDEKTTIDDIPKKILSQIFQKALSMVDSIQIKATYGEQTTADKDEEFINKIIDKELNSEKWQDFDRDIFLTEIPELSEITKDKKQIEDMISSEFPEEVLKGLELTLELPREDFISTTKEVIASLLQIKTTFFPNMKSEDYLDEINTFFKSTGYPEPYEKAQQLLWEYSVVDKKDSPKSTYTKKNRRKIIESIQKETDGFDFDTSSKSKNSLVGQLKDSIRKRINND